MWIRSQVRSGPDQSARPPKKQGQWVYMALSRLLGFLAGAIKRPGGLPPPRTPPAGELVGEVQLGGEFFSYHPREGF